MFMIEHILKQPSEVAGSSQSGWGSSPVLPLLREQISLSPAPMCMLSLSAAAEGDLWSESRLDVVYCWVYSSIISFSSLLGDWQLEGWKASLSKWIFFFFCFVLSCLPQTHDHLAYAVCSLCRNCQRANKAHGHAWAEHGWRLGTESIRWSLGQTFRSNGFFDWTDCRNSRSCHVCTQKRRATIYKFPFNALYHAKRIPYRLWDFKNSN